MDCTNISNFEDEEIIEPCRTCGIYFIANRAVIQPIFPIPATAGEISNGCMQEIVQQLNAWNLEVDRNDGRPQYMCIACIGEFQRLLAFKRSCLDTQHQFDELECKRTQKGLVIKKEISPSSDVEKFCGFIYLDTDDEDGSEEDGSGRVCAPLDIPHVPIKEEHAARVPHESKVEPMESIANDLSEEATFAYVKPEVLAATNVLASTLLRNSPEAIKSDDDDDEIIKFVYDDDDGEAMVMLPAPIAQPGVFCKLCGHASTTQDKHIEHMNRIHMVKDCECHLCGKKFNNAPESRLRFHMQWHKLRKHQKCPICGFLCNSKDTLKEHKLAVHTRCKCEFCGKTVKHRQLQAHLNRHLKEHEEELASKLESIQAQFPVTDIADLIACAFCEHTFEDAEQLQAHVQATHRLPSLDEAYLVDEPKKLALMDSTILTSQPEDKFGSPTDSKTLPTSLTSSQHSGDSCKPEKLLSHCYICGKKFDLKIKLNRHLKSHTKTPF